MSAQANRSPVPAAVSIARCPEHGLHGARTECFECGGGVEQVAYVEAGRVHAIADERDRLLAEVEQIKASAEKGLRAHPRRRARVATQNRLQGRITTGAMRSAVRTCSGRPEQDEWCSRVDRDIDERMRRYGGWRW